MSCVLQPWVKVLCCWLRQSFLISAYCKLVNDAHLFPETAEQMDKRLGDNEKNWRAREEVTAK
jgi:hypothetical protein